LVANPVTPPSSPRHPVSCIAPPQRGRIEYLGDWDPVELAQHKAFSDRIHAVAAAFYEPLPPKAAPQSKHFLGDALALYLKNHQDSKGIANNATRMVEMVKGEIGDLPLVDIHRAEAGRVLDLLLKQGWKTATTKKYLNFLVTIYNTGILEFELHAKNPFSSLKIPNLNEDAKDVPSFTDLELGQIASVALDQKTEQGLIFTMQIETGCRIAEITNLRLENVHLDAPIPYVDIRLHLEHGKRLKTGKDSERVLPLVGVTLEAARVASANAGGSPWLFPKAATRRTHPSGKVNKWIAKAIGPGKNSHSARHSLETRLVLAKTDQRLVDAIMGHKAEAKMGSVYFSEAENLSIYGRFWGSGGFPSRRIQQWDLILCGSTLPPRFINEEWWRLYLAGVEAGMLWNLVKYVERLEEAHALNPRRMAALSPRPK
jgi:integrase